MKKIIIVCLLFVFPLMALPQNKQIKIVFDVTSNDTLTHQAVIRHVRGMSEMYPDALLEVVIFGNAWPMVVNAKSTAGSAVQQLAEHENVSFKMCGLSMKRFGIAESDLIQGVEVVPDAIIEIVTKQGEGWGYIKESHN